MGFQTGSEVFLAAFSLEIAPFLSGNGAAIILRVSSLLSAVYSRRSALEGRERRAQNLVAFVPRQLELLKTFKQLLHGSQSSKHSKKRGPVRLSDGQLQPLLRDLVLVGLGVRASCLVDTCELEDAAIQRVLEGFNQSPAWRAWGLHRLRAIRLAGNVFFVNLIEFVRLKSRDLASELRDVVLIDASASLETPRVVGLFDEADLALRDELLVSTRDLVAKLLASAPNPGAIMHLRTANATAMAGLLLCYAVVYHVSSGGSREIDDDDAFWTTNANCLSMSPLYLVQTSITVTAGELRHQLPLQEFSIPQHVADGVRSFPRLKTISSSCRRSLVEAVGDSADAIAVHVNSTPRTLPHVAL